jgi:alpha-L-fucosidase 2
LPALPKAWDSGEVKGLKTRGGYTLNMTWSKGKVQNYTLVKQGGGTVDVYINGAWKKVKAN